MAQGMRVWDAAGNLIVEYTQGLGRVLDIVQLTGGTDGSATHPGLLTGTPFSLVRSTTGDAQRTPTITFDGDEVSWDYDFVTTEAYWLIYGVF